MPIMVKDGIVGRSAIRIIPGPVLEQLVAWAPQDRDAASEQSGEVVERGVLDGEAFITAFGQVLGVYTWDPPSVPNLEQIQGCLLYTSRCV